jgi:anti-sigma-K factor RskA
MWVIPKGGTPRPAGLFQSGPQGTALHILPGTVDPNVTVAVTVEPESGSPAPTSGILFAGGF